jgi:hypothetical protein
MNSTIFNMLCKVGPSYGIVPETINVDPLKISVQVI